MQAVRVGKYSLQDFCIALHCIIIGVSVFFFCSGCFVVEFVCFVNAARVRKAIKR